MNGNLHHYLLLLLCTLSIIVISIAFPRPYNSLKQLKYVREGFCEGNITVMLHPEPLSPETSKHHSSSSKT
jgi:hypothetical protein